MSSTLNHYAVLGIDQRADAITIKKAYHRLGLTTHPDKNPGDSEATTRFQRIQLAYSVLSDTLKRTQYDEELLAEKPMSFEEFCSAQQEHVKTARILPEETRAVELSEIRGGANNEPHKPAQATSSFSEHSTRSVYDELEIEDLHKLLIICLDKINTQSEILQYRLLRFINALENDTVMGYADYEIDKEVMLCSRRIFNSAILERKHLETYIDLKTHVRNLKKYHGLVFRESMDKLEKLRRVFKRQSEYYEAKKRKNDFLFDTYLKLMARKRRNPSQPAISPIR